MKKSGILMLALLLGIGIMTGCGDEVSVPEPVTPGPSTQPVKEEADPPEDQTEQIQETPEEEEETGEAFLQSDGDDLYHDYWESGGAIAFVTGSGRIQDGVYNQAVYDGVKMYAQGAGVSYSYYVAQVDSDEGYRKAVDQALGTDTRLVVTVGTHFDKIIGDYQVEYPNVAFLMIDGVPTDEDGNETAIAPNVHCILFEEQEAGYLAGYMAVMDGFRKFGFIGGESMDPVVDYGYGYLAGIDDAAKTLGVSREIEVNYWYSGSFVANSSIRDTAEMWYKDGTEVIFCCGGALYQSVLDAARHRDGWIIGVDINQNELSDVVLTSAMKGVDHATVIALDDYFAFGGWSEEMAGKADSYGVKEHCCGLPEAPWRFRTVTIRDYDNLYGMLRRNEIDVPNHEGAFPTVSVDVQEWR